MLNSSGAPSSVRTYWNNFNKRYSKNWDSYSKNQLSHQELGFIDKFINDGVSTVLDIGIGNGRILEHIICKTKKTCDIYGGDISNEMVSICIDKFASVGKKCKFETFDAAEKIPFENRKFDLITAIRVVKYNRNWKEFIINAGARLTHNGVFVFTFLNKNSLSIFGNYGTKVFMLNKREIEHELTNAGFVILANEGFSILPAVLYHCRFLFVQKVVLFFEKLFKKIFGKTLLQKEFFIAVTLKDV